MKTQRTNGLGAVAAAVVLASAGAAIAGPNTDAANLRTEIDALRAEVAQLKAEQSGDWLTEQRAEEVRALVNDVLADADTRASLLQSGATAGYDKGFFLQSPDGNFRLNLTGLLQVRFVYNNQSESPVDDNRWGFENKRTRLKFTGHVVDPSWQYFIQTFFSSSTGELMMFDAFMQKDFGNNWTLRAGKFKLPFAREQLTSHARLLAAERSLLNGYFGVGRSQGVQLAYGSEQFKFTAAYSDGLGSGMGATSPALDYDTEYALTGRVEFLAAGAWSQFKDYTSWQGEEFAMMFGGALHWENDEYGESAMGPETETVRWTIDGSAEFGGANVFAVLYGNHTDVNSDAIEGVDQYGIMVQGGFFLSEDWELYGRYEWADEDSTADDLSIITVGVNRYFSKHQLKWTTDLGYGLNAVSSTFASSGAGWREDTVDEDGQVVFRTQFQLEF